MISKGQQSKSFQKAIAINTILSLGDAGIGCAFTDTTAPFVNKNTLCTNVHSNKKGNSRLSLLSLKWSQRNCHKERKMSIGVPSFLAELLPQHKVVFNGENQAIGEVLNKRKV